MSNPGHTLHELYEKTEHFEIFVAVAQFSQPFDSATCIHNILQLTIIRLKP
jgi:hypothetical protein